MTTASHYRYSCLGFLVKTSRRAARKRFPEVDNYAQQNHVTTDKHAGFISDPQKVIYSLPAKPRLRQRGFAFLSAELILLFLIVIHNLFYTAEHFRSPFFF